MTNTKTTATGTKRYHLKVLVLAALLALTTGLLFSHARPAEAAFPGSNGRIVYQVDLSGNTEIFSMNSDGSDRQRLTINAAADEEPAVSPDGKRIAFVSDRSGNKDIRVMNADGSGVTTPLTTNAAADFDPAWSPDGKRIAFVSNRNTTVNDYDIFVMDAATESDTNRPARLTPSTAFDAAPAWSPDGSKIAYESDQDGDFDIITMNANGSDKQPRTSNTSFDGFPNFSPTGTKLTFMSDRDGNFNIFKMNTDGTGLGRLTRNLADDTYPSYSPGGKNITFTSARDGNLNIYKMNARDGSAQKVLTSKSAANDFFPDWGVAAQ